MNKSNQPIVETIMTNKEYNRRYREIIDTCEVATARLDTRILKDRGLPVMGDIIVGSQHNKETIGKITSCFILAMDHVLHCRYRCMGCNSNGNKINKYLVFETTLDHVHLLNGKPFDNKQKGITPTTKGK